MTDAAQEQLTDRIGILRTFPLFSDLDASELGRIADIMRESPLTAGTELIRQNENARSVYFLTKGVVRILVNGEMVALVDTIQCFGEMSCLIPDTPASATVVAAEESTALQIDRDDFLRVVNEIPKLWKTLFLQMSGRAKKVNMRLSEVLEHTPQGLMRVDREAKITNEYSIHCTRYFERDNLAGLPFTDIIFGDPATHPDPDLRRIEVDAWKEAYQMLFDDSGPLPFEDVVGLLTRELSLSRTDGSRSEFVLSYYPCREIDGSIVAIDIGVEDVTEARDLERSNAAMREEQEIMGKIYENPEAFLNMRKFMTETLADGVKLARRLGQAPAPELGGDFVITMRMLHSLKGFAGMFALKMVQEKAHHLETIVRAIETEPGSGKVSIQRKKEYIEGLGGLKEAYGYTETLMDRIGASLRKRLEGIVLSQTEFQSLKKCLAAGDLKKIQEIIQAAEAQDALKLFSGWEAEAQRLADKLDKQVVLEFEGEGGDIPKALFGELEQVLPHLLRNCLVHGLESPEEREAAGKDGEGRVKVRAGLTITDDQPRILTLSVEDDGRGIDPVRIVDIARRNERLDRDLVEQYASSGEEWRILFLPGFSTASQVTDIAGRGVGLDAVQDVVSSRGGDVTFDTLPENGSKVTLRIPC